MKSGIITFLWIKSPRSSRLLTAQFRLLDSIDEFKLTPLLYSAGPNLVPIGEVLTNARHHTKEEEAFVWCNSDVVLTRSPFDVPDPKKVYGFHRREIPSSQIALGVDMYYIPVRWWDDYLSKDIPKLYLGASYVDWWISRAMQNVGAYENLVGYIDHVTHPQSEAAGSDVNPYYQKNFHAFNVWAKKNGLHQISAPPYLLPKIGHVWGVRDALKKIIYSKNRK